MNKLEKLSVSECTIPVGNHCLVPSLLEAEAIFSQRGTKYKKIRLMHIITTHNEDTLQWCAMNSSADISDILPLFELDKEISGIPLQGKELEINEYIRHKNSYYLICKDNLYKQIIRQISVFATEEDVLAVYMLSAGEFVTDNTPPDIYLVKITTVDKPNDTLCISWFIDKEGFPPFFPVFAEDIKVFEENNINNLNWEFMHKGDTFKKDDKYYQICTDDNDDYYIAKRPTPVLKIYTKH